MIFTRHLNAFGVYLNPGVSSPVQGGPSTSVYKFDSTVRGQHVYKSVWTSLTDWCIKTHKCILVWEDDEDDKYAINDRL